jgi:hypothetical protein
VRREGLYTKPSADTISTFFNLKGTDDAAILEYYKTGGVRNGAIRDFLNTDHTLGAAARTVFTTLVRHNSF